LSEKNGYFLKIIYAFRFPSGFEEAIAKYLQMK